jgi:hypothetical protein
MADCAPKKIIEMNQTSDEQTILKNKTQNLVIDLKKKKKTAHQMC